MFRALKWYWLLYNRSIPPIYNTQNAFTKINFSIFVNMCTHFCKHVTIYTVEGAHLFIYPSLKPFERVDETILYGSSSHLNYATLWSTTHWGWIDVQGAANWINVIREYIATPRFFHRERRPSITTITRFDGVWKAGYKHWNRFSHIRLFLENSNAHLRLVIAALNITYITKYDFFPPPIV